MRTCFPEQSRTPEDDFIRSQTYRKFLDCLTDDQWSHAVGESLRLEKFFPSVSALLEYGEHAPPRLMDWSGECPLCENTGFEPFERGGYMYVRYCPRGCKVGEHVQKPDYRTDAEKRADAKVGLEQIKAAVAAREAKDAHEGESGSKPRRNHGRPTQRRDSGQVISPDGQGLP
jgi:hypothetical protein